jgi:hypothetical protein
MDSIQPNVTGRAVPRVGFSPDEAAASAGVSRTKIFEAIRVVREELGFRSI